MDENDVQPANEVFISSGKKETSSKTETSKITESNVELKSLSDYGENGNNLDGKCYKIRYKFGKGAFTIYQFGCGISKMVGPKGQLISKRLLEKIVWTKLATKILTISALVVKSKSKDTLLH